MFYTPELRGTLGSDLPTIYYKGDLMDAEVHTASKDRTNNIIFLDVLS